MKPVVHLRDVIEAIDVFGDGYTAYLNIHTGELLTLSDEDLWAAEEGKSLEDFPEW